MTLRLVTPDDATPVEAGEVLVIEYDSTRYRCVTCIPVPGSGTVEVQAEKDGARESIASALVS
jgi:hypothetical protein